MYDNLNKKSNDLGFFDFFELFAISLKAILIILAIHMMIYISDYGFILIATAMIPSIIAHFIDQEHYKYNSSALFAFNFAGLIPFLIPIWQGNSSDLIINTTVISRPKTWFVIYGSVLCGQIFIWLVEFVVIRILLMINTIKIHNLNKEIYEISSNWKNL